VVGNRLAGAVQAALLEVAAEVGQEAPGRVEDKRGGLDDGAGLDPLHAWPAPSKPRPPPSRNREAWRNVQDGVSVGAARSNWFLGAR
jgi:hypothetical protein